MTLKIGYNRMWPTCSLNRGIDFGIQKSLNYFEIKEKAMHIKFMKYLSLLSQLSLRHDFENIPSTKMLTIQGVKEISTPCLRKILKQYNHCMRWLYLPFFCNDTYISFWKYYHDIMLC